MGESIGPYNCHWLTPACVPFLQYWWWMWTGLLHKCPINWQLWRDIELRPRANVCSSSMAKVVWCSAHSCSDPEQATWFLLATGVLEALPEPNSSFPSLQYCEGDNLHRSDPWQDKSTWDWCERHINWQDWQGHTLHWSYPLQERKLWRDWFYMCALSTVLVMDMNWIATRMPRQLARPARHWTRV